MTTNTQEKGKQFESLNKQLEAEKKSVEILRLNLEGMKALEEENNKLKKEVCNTPEFLPKKHSNWLNNLQCAPKLGKNEIPQMKLLQNY